MIYDFTDYGRDRNNGVLGTWPIGRDAARATADDIELAGIADGAASDKMTVWMTGRGRISDL